MIAASRILQLAYSADLHDIEVTETGVIFLGFSDKANPPKDTSEAKFAICKVTNPNGIGDSKWTNGSRTAYDQVWDNRADLEYKFVKE